MADIKSVGIVGAGQMGAGIAQVCAAAGYQVRLYDVAPERVEAGLASIAKGFERLVLKGSLSQDNADVAIKRVKGVSTLADIGSADIAIEAATENEVVKKQIFRDLVEHAGKDTIFASNTSSISITRLASVTDRPGKFMGMHFMNPVPLMGLVELIRGIATEEETFRTVREVVVKLDKKPVNAEDFPAFIVNRILLPMINEAVYALYEGVGNVEAIDTGMKLGANHPMGPLELADFIGLDTCLSVMQVLHEGLADSKYRPCPLLVKYVEAGWIGRKVKRGFYDYSGERPVPTR